MTLPDKAPRHGVAWCGSAVATLAGVRGWLARTEPPVAGDLSRYSLLLPGACSWLDRGRSR